MNRLNTCLLEEIEKLGGDLALMERLLIYGEEGFIAWLVNRFMVKNRTAENRLSIKGILELLALLTDIPYYRIKYAYYDNNSYRDLSVLRNRKEYKVLRSVLEEKYNSESLWNSLLPYLYRHATNVAVEILIDEGKTAIEISKLLNVSKGLVYKIRSPYLKRCITKKGDYIDDTKFNK